MMTDAKRAFLFKGWGRGAADRGDILQHMLLLRMGGSSSKCRELFLIQCPHTRLMPQPGNMQGRDCQGSSRNE